MSLFSIFSFHSNILIWDSRPKTLLVQRCVLLLSGKEACNDLTIHRVFMDTTAAEWKAILKWLSEEYKKYTTVNDFNKAA